MTHLALIILFGSLMIPAIFLVLIPMMPAMFYMFIMSILFGFIDHFEHLRLWELAVLSGLFVLSVVIDHTAGLLGAKFAGANKISILYGVIGLVGGTIIFPPFGGVPGMFLTIFVAELFYGKKNAAALRAATGTIFGSISGVLVNFILAILFFALFIIFSI